MIPLILVKNTYFKSFHGNYQFSIGFQNFNTIFLRLIDFSQRGLWYKLKVADPPLTPLPHIPDCVCVGVLTRIQSLNGGKRDIFLSYICLFLTFVTETISRTDEGQPRPKYIFNKCETSIYFFTLQRFGPSQSPNFKYFKRLYNSNTFCLVNMFLEATLIVTCYK